MRLTPVTPIGKKYAPWTLLTTRGIRASLAAIPPNTSAVQRWVCTTSLRDSRIIAANLVIVVTRRRSTRSKLETPTALRR